MIKTLIEGILFLIAVSLNLFFFRLCFAASRRQHIKINLFQHIHLTALTHKGCVHALCTPLVHTDTDKKQWNKYQKPTQTQSWNEPPDLLTFG